MPIVERKYKGMGVLCQHEGIVTVIVKEMDSIPVRFFIISLVVQL